MPKITDSELVAAIQIEKSTADYQGINVLSAQREQADRAYAGIQTDDLVATTGMSSVIMNCTRPITNTLTTYLSKLFCSNKETVMFTPYSEEHTMASKQAMKMLNHILWKENKGYNIINGAARDAALHKNAIAKVTWDEMPVVKTQEFPEDIDSEAMDGFIVSLEEAGAEVEFEEDNVLRITYPKGMPRIELLPPEEFLINEGATRINDHLGLTRFVAHRRVLHKGDVQTMFPDFDLSEVAYASGGDSLDHDYETLNRHASDGTYNYISEGSGTGVLEQIELTESWIKADYNGDGKAVWVHAFTIGQTLIEKEVWDGMLPFASFCYFPIEHKFYGLSVYDVLKDYQRSATGLLRAEIDMRNQQNTFRVIADPRFIDQRTLQSGRPGIVPARPGFDANNVMALPAPQGSPNTLQLLEEIWKQIEREIGINPLTGQISTDVEKSGNDAAKTAMVIDNASAKVEEYARRFAEDFLKEIIWLCFDLLMSHKDDVTVAALAEKVTPGTPFLGSQMELDKSMLTAKVGLGHLTTQQKVQALGQIQGMQMQIEQENPGSIPLEKKLGLAYELTKELGYENVSDFLPTPQEAQQAQQAAQMAAQQAAQQPPDPLLQANAAYIQSQTQLNQAKIADIQVDNEIAARKQSLDEEKAAAELVLEAEQQRPVSIS